MRAIICDRCGKAEMEDGAAIIKYPYATMGQPEEQHLCMVCKNKLLLWMEKDDSND